MQSSTSLESSSFLRACRGEPVDRTPIWIMRQAGRYLPEYRAIRNQTTFLGLCKTPDLAAEVTLQPVRKFDLDAAILFSDILIPVEAMGFPVEFDEGPKLPDPIRSLADVEKLKIPDPLRSMPFVYDAIRIVRRELSEKPLIGFAGAPFTLASYMIEGGSSKNFVLTKKFFYEQPKVARNLLEKLARTVSLHLTAQIEAGASAVQIFDSWAGHLSPNDYRDFALPFTISIIQELKKKGAPIILFAKGVHSCIEDLAETGASILGFDWTIGLDAVRDRVAGRVSIQGNLDPVALFGPTDRIEREVQRILNEARGARGHIFNLGHGILPETPVENVHALVAAVHRLGRTRIPSQPA